MRYDITFRQKVLEIKHQEGLSIREVAERFALSTRTVQNWLQRISYLPCGRKASRGLKLDRAALSQHVAAHPDAYIAERAEHFGVARHTIWHALQGLKVSCKKNLGTPEGKYTKKG
jgi:transposase